MYGGVIAPPLIVGGAAGLSATDMALLVTAGLFVSGFATLLQTLGLGPFGSRLPIVQGISFASVSTMVTIASEDGLRPVFGAIIVAGVIGLVLSLVLRPAGPALPGGGHRHDHHGHRPLAAAGGVPVGDGQQRGSAATTAR